MFSDSGFAVFYYIHAIHMIPTSEDMTKQVERKQLEMQRLGDFVIPWKIKEPVKICIPFYLARYSSRSEVRYNIVPPVRIETDPSGLSRATRRLTGLEARMTSMLKPLDISLSNMIIDDISSSLLK